MKNKFYLLLFSACSLIWVSGTIDLDNLHNYQNQAIPDYITEDNTVDNLVTDAGATLGRVLFYDKKLSLNNTVACSSCHLQEFAFGDTAQVSVGVDGGMTARHSMRLVNARFSTEQGFFWDERADNLEQQSTMPIQDHIEMGFSGTGNQPSIDSLFDKLENIDYYNQLFEFVFGDTEINETRLQIAISQFIRSIQSFDSKYDIGRTQVENNQQPFPNFTPAENMGKNLFTTPTEFDQDGIRIGGGAGCQGCHRAPEFDIAPISRNNGVIQIASGEGIDISITRAPTLRDLFNPQGQLNGGLMHNGFFTSLEQVINHYNEIPNNPLNTNLDPRLRPSGNLQNLNLTDNEKSNLIAFLRTLTGADVYTNEKWSNPFEENGTLNLIGGPVVANENLRDIPSVHIYPNPAKDYLNIEGLAKDTQIDVINLQGQYVSRQLARSQNERIALDRFEAGTYFLMLQDEKGKTIHHTQKIIIVK